MYYNGVRDTKTYCIIEYIIARIHDAIIEFHKHKVISNKTPTPTLLTPKCKWY
jgi:hypothetical protein